jgi:hypothetical protein
MDKYPRNMRYFCNFQISAQCKQSHIGRMGENSPNQVTLVALDLKFLFKGKSKVTRFLTLEKNIDICVCEEVTLLTRNTLL